MWGSNLRPSTLSSLLGKIWQKNASVHSSAVTVHSSAVTLHTNMFKPTKCERVNCSNISYSRRAFYNHRKSCKVKMSYKEHSGYEHLEALIKKPTVKFAIAYHQTLEDDEREQLRGCLALYHKELQKRKKLYEDMQKEADVLKNQMTAINSAPELSEDPSVEPPPKKAKEDESARQPTLTNWTLFGGGSSTSSTATGPSKV